MPAAAVIPAPLAYTIIVAVKRLVVGLNADKKKNTTRRGINTPTHVVLCCAVPTLCCAFSLFFPVKGLNHSQQSILSELLLLTIYCCLCLCLL